MARVRFKAATRRLRDERGVTLAELMIAALISVTMLGVASYVLIVAVRAEPALAKRDFAIQQGRVLQESFARELRQSSFVEGTPTSSAITFDTYLRRTQCGGSVEADSTKPAIVCKVTYSCASGTCNRTEGPLSGQPGSTVTRQLVTGLQSSAVFGYLPDATSPTYVSTQLVFPATGGEDAVTLDDGVQLRNR
jgi:Tfp pilus assembly protein PilW